MIPGPYPNMVSVCLQSLLSFFYTSYSDWQMISLLLGEPKDSIHIHSLSIYSCYIITWGLKKTVLTSHDRCCVNVFISHEQWVDFRVIPFLYRLPRLPFEFHLCPCVFSWLNSPLIILDIDFPLPIDLCHGLSDALSTNFPFIFPATPSPITSTLWAWQLIQSSFRPPHYSLSIDASPRCSY